MRKIIKKAGVTRGEITISISHNLTYNIDTLEWVENGANGTKNKALLDLSKKSYTVTANVGSTSLISVSHVKPGKLEDIAVWVEDWLNQYIDAIDDDKAEEATMRKHMYMF